MKSRFGVRSAFGTLERVLVHRPGPELDVVTPATLDEFNFARPVDRTRFAADYDAMLDCFSRHGVDVVFLTDVLADDREALAYMARRPNMTYTRDLACVFSSGAVLMGPHLIGRRGDQWMLGRAFERLGIPVLGHIAPPGFLEGGGVTMLGTDTVVASLCDRANEAGTAQLRELALGGEMRFFLEVPLPPGHIHIDGLFMLLDEDLCLIHEETLGQLPCRLYEAGRSAPRQVTFGDYLVERNVRRIAITEQERLEGHLNLVVVKRGRLAVEFGEAVRLRGELAKLGWTIENLPSAELASGRGGAHCMTCPLLVR
ncbi:MAG: hypothetical protein HYY24_22265 [Verrucomicrobia bacterium]|nr:hypothetical protein [Verrucomicrobiota bacterium]